MVIAIMANYIISDDIYFALGCEAIFNSHGEKLKIISSSHHAAMNLFKIKNDDIILISIESHPIRKKIFRFIHNLNLKIIFFIDAPKCPPSYACWKRGFISKKIAVELLFPTFILFKNSNEKNNFLTKREREVINAFLNGMSATKISTSMSLSTRTVYAHRKNALTKLGLRKIRTIFNIEFYRFIFQISPSESYNSFNNPEKN
ncbi:TPA: hypothetical protein SLN52_000691 [Serratia marcescens]|nr:hypothetical protein [Serratia marcescens]